MEYESESQRHMETVSKISWDRTLSGENVWKAEADAFRLHLKDTANCLNKIADYRLEEDDQLFGENAKDSFLELGLEGGRISKETLEVFMKVQHEMTSISRLSLEKRFKFLKIENPRPWEGFGQLKNPVLLF